MKVQWQVSCCEADCGTPQQGVRPSAEMVKGDLADEEAIEDASVRTTEETLELLARSWHLPKRMSMRTLNGFVNLCG